jgi:hypothetical protein
MVLMNLFSLQNQVLNRIETNNNNNNSISSSLIIKENISSSSSFSSISSSNVFSLTSALSDILNNNLINQTNITTNTLPAFELVLGTFTYLLIIGITILGFYIFI